MSECISRITKTKASIVSKRLGLKYLDPPQTCDELLGRGSCSGVVPGAVLDDVSYLRGHTSPEMTRNLKIPPVYKHARIYVPRFTYGSNICTCIHV
eukprot:1325468-Amorphochlora_amoeboformis.AAC.3